MSHSVISEDNFERDFEARLARNLERRLSAISSTARAWLALVPAWTDQLALACDFPAGTTSLSEFLQTAQKAGLTQGLSDGRFWMPEHTRAAVLSELRKEEHGSKGLVNIAAEIGQKITVAEEKGIPVSPIVSCWAELASHTEHGLDETFDFFISTVDRLLKTGNDTGRALALVSAGKSLASALGGPLESAVRVGEHRIELVYRKEQDERHLIHLLPREEQVAAFKYLMENQDGVWALHYVGMGGVGKTMMLRQITARLAPEYNAATSRVDFDFLNPDYPVRLPGQLLLELAAELHAYITNPYQEHKFERFQSQAISLHESLSHAEAPAHPLANIRSQGFMDMLQVFCDFLSMLPGPKVLILDTCEELAKAQLSGGKLPILDATFEIIEQIHRQASNVRFVFAGRRLLAMGGRHWRAGWSESNGKSYLPEMKDYLGLHEVLGFNEREAGMYLRDIEELSITDSLQKAIFSRSQEAGVAGKIIRVPPKPVVNELRYNPFDLSLYAEWVKADPKLEASVIETGRIDPYVENRIVQRLKNPHVQALLPSVVLLKRFNKEMILPAMAGNVDGFEEAFRELSDQEWIDHRRDESIEEWFLEVNRHLYDRLYDYFAHTSRRTALDAAAKKLWPNLVTLVRQLPFGKLSVDHVDAVLRLAPAHEGATLWDELNQRITNEGNWNWAQQVTSLILGENGAVKDKTHPLRAAVLATQAVALFHQNSSIEQTSTWKEIGDLADRHPNAEIATWLSLRSRMKVLADFRFEAAPSAERWNTFQSWVSELSKVFDDLSAYHSTESTKYHREQLIASFCATIETRLENTDDETEWGLKLNDVISLKLPGRIRELTSSEQLRAFCCTVVGRALARKGRWGEVQQLLDRAEELATNVAEPSIAWEDWRAPARLLERIRLEVLTTIPPRIGTFPAEQMALWQEQASDHLDQIDAERLVSHILERSLAHRVLTAEELEALAAKETYVLERIPVCAAHRATPPLMASLVMGWLALGRGDMALSLLNQRREVALHTRKDPDTVRAMEDAKLKVVRRLRLQGVGVDIINRMVKSENEEDIIRVRELLALISSTDSEALLVLENASPAVLHAWWRGRVTLSGSTAVEPVERIKELGSHLIAESGKLESEINATQAHFMIDWQEACLLAVKYSSAPVSTLKGFLFSADDWWEHHHPTRTVDGLSLVVRSGTLQEQFAIQKRIVDQVGPRLTAEIALQEGELLALRLPAQAAVLLDQAYTLFCEVKDYWGAFMAMVLSTIAELHSEQKVRAERRITATLLPLYTQLAASRSDLKLPSPSQIENFLREPTFENAKSLDHSWLNGWIQRLVRCQLWVVEQKDKKSVIAGKAREWLKSSFGANLPVELAIGADYVKGRRRLAIVRKLRRLWSFSWPILGCTVIGTIAYLVIAIILFLILPREFYLCMGLPVMGLVLFLLKPIYGWIRDARGTPVYVTILVGILMFTFLYGGLVGLTILAEGSKEWSTVWPFLIKMVATLRTFVLLGVAIFAVLWAARYFFRKHFAALYASRAEVALELSPDSSDADVAQPEELPVTITLTRLEKTIVWLLAFYSHRGTKQETKERWNLPGLTTYQKIAAGSPYPIAAEFGGLEERLRNRKLPVALRIASSLVGWPWEAFFILAMPRKRGLKLQFWRRGEALPVAKISAENLEGVCVLGSETWSLMIQQGWEPLTPRPEILKYSPKLKSSEPRRVLHLIGQPDETSAGLRLLSRVATAAHSPATAGGSASQSIDDEGMLFGVDDLPIASAALVVLQAEPVPDLLPRMESDRSEVTKLRTFANDVFTAGAQAVLVLPTLPPGIAQPVLNILAGSLAKSGTSGLCLLLTAVDQMRVAIRDRKLYESPTEREAFAGANEQLQQELEETRLELALDVCLFARPDPS